jgi:hypothetical protein
MGDNRSTERKTFDSTTVAKRLGMHGDGLTKQKESSKLFAELKKAGAITGLDDKTLSSKTNSVAETREEMNDLLKNRYKPLSLDTLG